MELFVRIPNVKQEAADNAFSAFFGDISTGLKFIFNEKPLLAKILITIFLIQLALAPFAIIGIPVLITRNLGMNESMVGIAHAAMGVGGILGGILTGVLGKRLRIQRAHWLLFIAGLVFLPIGIAFLLDASYFATYIIIVLATLIAMTVLTLFTIQILTFVQIETPPEMLGKVSALSTMIIMMGLPIGQFIFGMLFERFDSLPWVVVFISVVMSVLVALNSRQYFRRVSK